MNYRDYLGAKQACEKKITIYSISVYIITLFALAQATLLITKVNFSLTPINLIIVEKLYSMGYNINLTGNIVFTICLYGAFALIVLSFIAGSVLVAMRKRTGIAFHYIIIAAIYIFDALLCFGTAAFIQLGVHLFLIVFLILSYRSVKLLEVINSNTWG